MSILEFLREVRFCVHVCYLLHASFCASTGPDLVSFLQSRQVKQRTRGRREDEERGGRDGDERGGRDGDKRGGNVEEKEGNETQGGITAALEDEGGDGGEVEREETKPLGWSAGNNQEGTVHASCCVYHQC